MTENDEIRLKIAKLKGAFWWELDGSAYLCFISSLLPKGVQNVVTPSLNSKRYYKVPNWTENIADAWELVEEMKFMRLDFFNSRWYCWITHKVFQDNTAPLAICKAWIAWKESQ